MLKPIASVLGAVAKGIERPWFPIALILIATIDNFIFFIPMLTFMIVCIISHPKRWIRVGTATVIGTSIGGTLFAVFVSRYGISFFEKVYPALLHERLWIDGHQWIEQYGTIPIFLASLAPITDHPLIALAAMTNLSLLKISLALTLGKTIKYLFFAYLASHAPRQLKKFKFIQKQMEALESSKENQR